MNRLPILYEDNHLLVVNKPAGLVTMGSQEGVPSVVTLAAEYLKHKYHKPGKVFIGVVSRLDRLVSGVLVLARTSKSASRLSEQFRTHTTEKQYVAWVEGRWPLDDWTELVDWIHKDESAQRMRVVAASSPQAQQARLRVKSLHVEAGRTQVAIELTTGRKHQIRLQFSQHGHPILGDTKYEATSKFPRGIALHSRFLEIQHPTRDQRLSFEADIPAYWPAVK